VGQLGHQAADDSAILARAAEEDRVLLSADTGFSALLAFGGHKKPSLVLFRRETAGGQPNNSSSQTCRRSPRLRKPAASLFLTKAASWIRALPFGEQS